MTGLVIILVVKDEAHPVHIFPIGSGSGWIVFSIAISMIRTPPGIAPVLVWNPAHLCPGSDSMKYLCHRFELGYVLGRFLAPCIPIPVHLMAEDNEHLCIQLFALGGKILHLCCIYRAQTAVGIVHEDGDCSIRFDVLGPVPNASVSGICNIHVLQEHGMVLASRQVEAFHALAAGVLRSAAQIRASIAAMKPGYNGIAPGGHNCIRSSPEPYGIIIGILV